MRKWSFWGLMCLVSLVHWMCFFQGTLEAFNKGIPGVDNQAALLFIPFFWVMAAAALVVLRFGRSGSDGPGSREGTGFPCPE